MRSHTCMGSDIFSFGLLMWYLVTEKEPYDGSFNQEAANKVAGGWRLPIPGFVPEEIADLIAACWKMKPQERITADELCDELEQLTKVDFSSYSVQKFQLGERERRSNLFESQG